ncbi:xanthine dehydrogenase accessory factor [Rhodoligotrophos appendicifer]|uniref:XdhC family protein n=1 Tax=Rhodoligotrophos appendicifer TaxID=987056 RepID=UPI0011854D53|nr:XdhC family protein [Rhodoligotrophos appendicifer]
MERSTLTGILDAVSQRRAVALITYLSSGCQELIGRSEIETHPLGGELDYAFRYDKSSVVAGAKTEIFINVYNPPLRLIIIGAVHISQSVIPMAQALGYDVTVIDPRGAFATEMRFPDVDLRPEWPDEVLPQIGFDPRTALIALTHDPKIDDPALIAGLRSDCFYVGALGSKRTHAGRLDRLRSADFSDHQLDLIHAPIGLDIGARGAPEIAVSIMAEITKALRLGRQQT